MSTAEQFRTQGAESSTHNEDWLADNFDKTIHSRDVLSEYPSIEEPLDSEAVAKIDDHVLRRLGAAVMMQWNTIPTKLQRELFDAAGSLGKVIETVTLRGRIARFLHSHKGEEMPADGISKPDAMKGNSDDA
jgi:hypothetical protein